MYKDLLLQYVQGCLVTSHTGLSVNFDGGSWLFHVRACICAYTHKRFGSYIGLIVKQIASGVHYFSEEGRYFIGRKLVNGTDKLISI